MNRSRCPERILISGVELGFRDVLLVGQYNYTRAHPPLKRHAHNGVYEVCVLAKGTQTYFVGRHRYDIESGDVFITRPGEIHSTGHEPEGKGQLYWMQLCGTPTDGSLLGLSAEDSELLRHRLQRLHCRHFHQGACLVPTLERVFSIYANRGHPMRAPEIRNLLLRLIFDVLALAEHRGSELVQRGIAGALACVEANTARLVSLAELARAASMSDSYFKKVFKQQMGVGPIEYAMRRRIGRSKQELCKQGTSILDVAMAFGFSTGQHFATTFKRFTGLTPRQYRSSAVRKQPPDTPETGNGVAFHPLSPWPT